ncbi:SPOR domain-containing protein [Streptomyces albidus (ex Kaewkla and Franco 2022)]|uniref:SPOR domain-containing protein n=1 Tax=Streptomyces albidus (ex Kaewkla and Franco 2022) TaxID=722709 RepID=UPI001F1B2E9A|nr:SPOR domain-containing protein [Streptomyces albidus (ex Kaewkla and Franco 2022)]
MRSVSGDSDAVLPWHVIREDSHGNRYRVGSYATRTEAELAADRLCAGGSHARGAGEGRASYLVEPLGCASGEYA